MFVGFIDGSHAIKYYNAPTKHIGTTQNYHFVTHPQDIQFEGEEEPKPAESQDSMGNNQIEFVGDHEALKHKHPDNQDLFVQRNLRPHKQVDYRMICFFRMIHLWN